MMHGPRSVPPEVRAILVDEVRGLPFHADACAFLWAVCAGVVADGARHRGSAEGDESVRNGTRYPPEQQQTFAAKIVQETKVRTDAAAAVSNDSSEGAHHGCRRAGVHAVDARDGSPPQAVRRSQSPAKGDAARGRAVFEKRCTGCHALTENREGPKLQGVYGRTSAQCRGFCLLPGTQEGAYCLERCNAGAMAYRSRRVWFPATTWTSASPGRRSVKT